jgi:uncharacterized protein YdcH (DUF465 family)
VSISIALAPIIAVVALALIDIGEQNTLLAYKLRKLSELVGKGYALESRGRALAYASNMPITLREDGRHLRELTEFYEELVKAILDIEGYARYREDHTIENILRDIVRTADDIYWYLKQTLQVLIETLPEKPVKRDTPIRDVSSKLEDVVVDSVREIGMLVKALTNWECIWILDKIKKPWEYTFSNMHNDITACHHRILEFIELTIDPETERVTRRVFSRRGNRELEVACIEWDMVAEELFLNGLIDPSDYHPTRCIVWDKNAEVKVGTMPGHSTHVEIVDNEVRAEYYDIDESVHTELIRLAEKLGARVEEHVENEYTVITLPTDKICILFKQILPFLSSMDHRITHPEMWKTVLTEKTIDEIKKTPEHERVLEAIKRLGLKC